jgi:hypothetical protein
MGGALAVGGLALGAGIPQVQLTAASTGAGHTDFIVTGAVPHATVDVVRLSSEHGRFVATVVAEGVKSRSTSGPFSLSPASTTVKRGIYVAIEATAAHTVVTSQPFAWKTSLPARLVSLVKTKAFTSPATTLGGRHVRAEVGPGSINGQVCGSLSTTKTAEGWTVAWTGCSTILNDPAAYNGDTVLVYGAAPYNGGNPFDNPQVIEGVWVGTINVTGNTVASVNIGFDNNVGAFNGQPFTPGEWFNMGMLSSAVESPAGQLPEAPWAAALPFAVAVPGLALWLKNRRGLKA